MVEGEVRIYFKPDEELEAKIRASMRTLGFYVWSHAQRMGDMELCFLPVETRRDYYESFVPTRKELEEKDREKIPKDNGD